MADATNDSQKKRLIVQLERYDRSLLSDFLSIVAANIEDAMMQCGAEPGKDYTYKDIFELAIPFAVDMWRSDKLEVYQKK